MIYALDSNIISYLVDNNKQIISQARDICSNGGSIVIPPMVYYEVLRGFRHRRSPKKESAFFHTCSMFPVGKMNIDTWEKAADIYGKSRKTGRVIDDGDILIAAFCVTNGYTLVTNNEKHFKGIEGLAIENWC